MHSKKTVHGSVIFCCLACLFSCSRPLTPGKDKPPVIKFSTTLQVNQSFRMDSIFGLEAFDSVELSNNFENDYLTIIYFSNVSCSTCVSRELEAVKEMYNNQRNKVDFIVVTNGHDEYYLRNLRRIGQIKFPILIERNLGELGFPEKLTISFLDKRKGEIIFQYSPLPSNKFDRDFSKFEKMVLKYIQDN